MNKQNMLKYGALAVAIILSIILHIYDIKNSRMDIDQFQHYIEMKTYYENDQFFPFVGMTCVLCLWYQG